MANETEFLFFFPSDRWTATSARGVWGVVEPEIVSETLKMTWRREAICLSVQVLKYKYAYILYILSFDAHSAII